ncbi:MAG: PQQ-binding-like beta-propeller repeat protein, partial [Verrucomicrobia bacterium]|nr:PQQ-binding-like beta-propeller repeat protein [Verrucomicrobiota bacterium]
GISAETGWTTQWPADGPKQLWKTSVGTGCASVAVSGGRVFTLGNQSDTDTVVCLDANTGAALWKHAYACPLDPNLFEGGPAATPTVDGDRVYTLSRSGHLFCFQTATGKVVWSKHLHKDLRGKMPTWGYSGSPLALGNALLLDAGAPAAATVAFDKMTGAVLWKNGHERASYGSLTPFTRAGKSCLASFNVSGLTVRDAANGAPLAHTAWKTDYDINPVTPIVAGGKIFISSGYNKGCALFQLGAAGLAELWHSRKMRNHFNSCVLWQDCLYGFDDSTLTCMDFATGAVKWQEKSLGKGSLMIAGGKLVIQGEKGDLAVAEPSPAAYKQLARAKVLGGRCWVVPVIANGRVYCKNNLGDLVCMDVSGK